MFTTPDTEVADFTPSDLESSKNQWLVLGEGVSVVVVGGRIPGEASLDQGGTYLVRLLLWLGRWLREWGLSFA